MEIGYHPSRYQTPGRCRRGIEIDLTERGSEHALNTSNDWSILSKQLYDTNKQRLLSSSSNATRSCSNAKVHRNDRVSVCKSATSQLLRH